MVFIPTFKWFWAMQTGVVFDLVNSLVRLLVDIRLPVCTV
jgi:hypothetical protein